MALIFQNLAIPGKEPSANATAQRNDALGFIRTAPLATESCVTNSSLCTNLIDDAAFFNIFDEPGVDPIPIYRIPEDFSDDIDMRVRAEAPYTNAAAHRSLSPMTLTLVLITKLLALFIT